MSKRTIVQVDEEKLKRMIAGDDEEEQNVTNQPAVEPAIPAKEVGSSEEKENTNPGIIRKKKQKTEYNRIYLKQNKPSLKRPVTIQLAEDNYRKMSNLLMLSPGISIAMFINNVLDTHFMEYAEDINEVIEQGIRKLKNNG